MLINEIKRKTNCVTEHARIFIAYTDIDMYFMNKERLKAAQSVPVLRIL